MRRAKRLVLAAAIAVPATLALLFVLGVLVRAFSLDRFDFGAIDPTEQTFTVTIRNDLPEAVLIKQCDVHCGSEFHEIDRLQPGASVQVNTSGANVPNWWVIDGNAGKTLGCLNLLYDHKAPGVVVLTSQMMACAN
jgi:hypothetical protein